MTRRAAPTAVAALAAAVYLAVHPMSLDLAAHLARAQLFSAEGFGLWDNWWYDGHHVLGYSVLFPPLAAALTPQLVAALAAPATAAAFEALAHARYGPRAWLGATWFGAATATELLTGRLTFAFALLPAVAALLALQRRRTLLTALLAALSALASPVAALFTALAGVSVLLAEREARGALTAGAALAPVALLAWLFPEGGSEPFALATLWPLLVTCAVAVLALPREEVALRIGAALYGLGCLGAYLITSPVGSNAARLGPLAAGPVAALSLRESRRWLLVACALPLLYLQWQAPVRDLRTAAGDPSGAAAYWRPLLSYLERQPGGPFRVEIPFTQFHMEAYRVAPYFPLPRGWERQLDIRYNPIFYDGTLSAATYERWLHANAVRFVVLTRGLRLDYAGRREQALVQRGLPYLGPAVSIGPFRVLAVQRPTPIANGAASATAIGPNSVTLHAQRPGVALVRIHFTPYWRLSGAPGCVAPAGDFTRVEFTRSGPARLVIAFALGRAGSRAARCTSAGAPH